MAKGIFVFLGELAINYNAHINLAIIYSFTGEFQKSKEILDTQWLLPYCGILVYAVWDSYRLAVEFNKLSVLGDRENAQITPTSLGNVSINSLEKRNPWLSIVWSLLVPGLGQLYNAETFKAIFLLLIGLSITIVSHAFQAIGLSAIGEFQQAKAIIDPQWFLNIPSFYVYTVWDAYTGSVELNKLFDQEQAQYFRNNYQSTYFENPGFSEGG